MFDPKTSHKGNLQVGLGLKLPTGSYNYMDYFYKKPDSSVLGPVDQSIQPGDGGTGITLELNGFYNFSHKIGAYGSFFYLSNPREVNGTSTTRVVQLLLRQDTGTHKQGDAAFADYLINLGITIRL
jgi:hypothetical protein